MDYVEDSFQIFSTPNRSWCPAGTVSQGGLPPNGCGPWGTAQHNNVAKMNTLVAQIKTFRNDNLYDKKIGQLAADYLNNLIVPIITE